MPADLTLYTNPMSRGRIARWMLEETGAPYDTVLLEYADTMKADDYLAINPMGKVPAIVHRGHVVTEGAAICAYLAEAFPAAALMPADDGERADYYRWLFFAAGPVEASVTNRSLGVVPTEQQRRMVGYGSHEEVVRVLEGAVARHRFITGERFTAADVYVGSQIMWGMMFGSIPKLPVFEAYAERLSARDAYRMAQAKDDAAMPQQPDAG